MNLSNSVAIVLPAENFVACVTIRLFNIITHNGI